MLSFLSSPILSSPLSWIDDDNDDFPTITHELLRSSTSRCPVAPESQWASKVRTWNPNRKDRRAPAWGGYLKNTLRIRLFENISGWKNRRVQLFEANRIQRTVGSGYLKKPSRNLRVKWRNRKRSDSFGWIFDFSLKIENHGYTSATTDSGNISQNISWVRTKNLWVLVNVQKKKKKVGMDRFQNFQLNVG